MVLWLLPVCLGPTSRIQNDQRDPRPAEARLRVPLPHAPRRLDSLEIGYTQ